LTGDGLQADLDELAGLAVRLRTLMVGFGSGAPASGPTWQATAAAVDGVHANVDAASEAFGTRIGDTASGVDGAAAKLADNEGISADMVSSIGSAGTAPGAVFGSALSDTAGDVTSAFTRAVGDVTGHLTGAVSTPLGALAGAVNFAALADIANGDNGGLFDGLVGGDSDEASLASGIGGDSDAGEVT
jgi:hypothetical protein